MNSTTDGQLTGPIDRFVRFLEVGESDRLFADDVSAELNFPQVQMHASSAAALVTMRRREHPGPTKVHVERLDRTERGWVVQLEEWWERDAERWYSRELFRVDVEDDRIVGLVVYCTGDWDEGLQRAHAAGGGAAES